MISKKLLDELKQIFLEDYGIELTPEQVGNLGDTLLSVFKLLIESYEEKEEVSS